MAFVDEITITAKAGKGGDGVVRWIRERRRPKGGPGGGNGGRGGDVFFVAVRDLGYLSTYRHEKNFSAENGVDGAGKVMHGRNGEDLDLRVPVGSVIRNEDTGEVYELIREGERIKVLTGGGGGYGNHHFKGSKNQQPMQSTKGKPGEAATFSIELKLIADAALIGLPSAGKSTLLNALTNAHSEVGAYPFTTLEPHLGVFHNYILADVPGLIKGASEGKGLGHKFLRHITRTRFLLHLVSVEQEDALEAYQTIRDELIAYDPGLGEKPEVVVLSKTDLVSTEKQQELVALFTKEGKEVWRVSVENEATMDTFTTKLSQFLKKHSLAPSDAAR